MRDRKANEEMNAKDTTGCRCAAGAADGNVKGCPSYDGSRGPQRYESEPSLDAFRARVEKLPHLMRGVDNWYQALHKAIDLLEHPNNLDALWVWSRFLHSFGRLDTWEADRCLDKLVYYEGIRKLREKKLLETPKWRVLKRRQLAEALRYSQSNVNIILDHILTNNRNWPDREAFEAHKGKTG